MNAKTRMKRLLVGVLGLALFPTLVGEARAQNVLDQIPAGLEDAALQSMMLNVSNEFLNPASVQFRGLVYNAAENAICGEVNGRSLLGGASGFRGFAYLTSNQSFFIYYSDTQSEFFLAAVGIVGCVSGFANPLATPQGADTPGAAPGTPVPTPEAAPGEAGLSPTSLGNAQDDLTAQVAACAAEANMGLRLGCYGRIAAELSPNLPGTPISAQIAECAAEPNLGLRVACYDLLATTLGTPPNRAPAVALPTTHWIVRSERSRIDDSTNVWVAVRSSERYADRFGNFHQPTLYIRCMEDTTAIILDMDSEFMSDTRDFGTVIFRIDDQPATSIGMIASTDHMALGIWNGGTSIPWVRRLFGGHELVVRATPFNESTREFSFQIAGLEEAIVPLRTACHW